MNKVKTVFKKLGFEPLGTRHKNENGVDLWVIKDNRCFSVEIKTARKLKLGQLQVPPIEVCRRKDDFIAIIINKNYILVEPMKDHLLNCSHKGYRNLTLMR